MNPKQTISKSRLPRVTGATLLAMVLAITPVLQAQNSAQDYPEATATDTPGVVRSPYPPNRMLDVQGLEAGELAQDPDTGEVFRIPYPPAAIKLEPNPNPTEPNAPVREGSFYEREVPPHVERFVRSFVAMGESDRPETELPFYEERVRNYFGKPDYTHDDIHEDRRDFIREWPERSYTIEGEPVLLDRDGDYYDVMVRIRYDVEGPGGSSSGNVTTYMTLHDHGNDLKIASIEERRALPPVDSQVGYIPREGESDPRVENLPESRDSRPHYFSVDSFVESFIRAGESDDPSAVLGYFNFPVDRYYGDRNVSPEEMLRDRSDYIRKWPSRRYWLNSELDVDRRDIGVLSVEYEVGYEVANSSRSIDGSTEVALIIVETRDGYRIVSVKED